MAPPKRHHAAVDDPPTPIAKRSKSMLTPLVSPCCVRCAQYLLDGGVDCDKTDEKKCWRCAKLHKACHEVPAKFWSEVNPFIELREDESTAEVPTSSHRALKELNDRMRASTRKANKFGGFAKPKSTVDAVLVLVKEVQGVKEVLT